MSLRNKNNQIILGAVISIIVFLIPFTSIPIELSMLEVISFIAYGWSTWLLANNNPLGWWVGLIGVVGYMYIFFNVQLYAETGIQTFYLLTSLQAIYIWLKGGQGGEKKPVSYVPRKVLWITIPLFIVAVIGLRMLLIEINGAAPFWDSLSTVMSLIAHIYLMQRYVNSWYIWIAVDIIYIPLYASRGLHLTSILYAGLLLMAINGLINFRKIINDQNNTGEQSS
jgi:nicotinamide mononucleotide transporter